MIQYIHGGRVLLDGDAPVSASVTVVDGVIGDIGGPAPPGAFRIDAGGLLILPGIVDLHGDAFERQLMPRPGVSIDPALALLDTDRQLLANGITTAYHAMTWSWEPGLRSRDAGGAFVEALAAARPWLGCDTRLHLRHETYNFEGETAVVDWLLAGRVDLLAINDHTPSMVGKIACPQALSPTADRAGLPIDDFIALLKSVHAREPEVASSIRRLCAVARGRGVPMASHDDSQAAVREGYAALGCTICEFPQNLETVRAARDGQASVVMGAPNVLRGGSHIGLVGAADLIGQGLCDILVSDYFYPSLPAAPFRLARDGVCGFGTAWRLISANPATAAGLRDRGAIEPGARADIVLLDAADPARPRVEATFVAGRAAFLTLALERMDGASNHAPIPFARATAP